MPRYKVYDQKGLNYLTLSIVGWVDIMSRKIYRDIVVDSLKYCQEHKDLLIFGYVIMTNHVHIIVQIKEDSNHELSGVIRDFKKFTAHKFIAFLEGSGESRRAWMMEVFKKFGKTKGGNRKYQIWTNNNHPIELYSPKVIWQKLDYIHQNPVKAGIADKPEEYLYSSARNYYMEENEFLLAIDLLEPFMNIGFKYYPGR